MAFEAEDIETQGQGVSPSERETKTGEFGRTCWLREALALGLSLDETGVNLAMMETRL